MTRELSASRREVLRGAALAGGLAWTVPAVQLIAPPAHASGSVRPELSYVALLLLKGSTFYRVKYEFSTEQDKPAISVVAGRTWAAGLCQDAKPTREARPFYKNGTGLPLAAGQRLDAAETAPPTSVVAKHDVYSRDGGFYVILPVGVELYDWMVHKGQCCAVQPGRLNTKLNYATCQTDPTGGRYSVQFLQQITTGAAQGNQWLFPASPNDVACTTIGQLAYSNPCPKTTAVPGKP